LNLFKQENCMNCPDLDNDCYAYGRSAIGEDHLTGFSPSGSATIFSSASWPLISPIVFPTDGVAQSTLIKHVAERVSLFHAFEVVFWCAILGDPDFMGHEHAFLRAPAHMREDPRSGFANNRHMWAEQSNAIR
jgi:hypothetical protein